MTGSRIQFKRGTFAELVSTALVPADGEPIWTNGSADDKGEKRMWVGDGGGLAGAQVGWWTGNHPGMKRLWYYNTTGPVTSHITGTILPNLIAYTPFWVGDYDADSEWSNIDSVSFNCAAAEASKNVRLAIYDSRNGAPTNLLYESGNISVATNGIKTWSISGTARLPMGWYWLASNNDTSTATFRLIDNLGSQGYMVGNASLAFVVNNLMAQAHTFGAFPDPAAATAGGSSDHLALVARRSASTS